MASQGGGEPIDFLVANGEESFGTAVAGALKTTDEPGTAEALSSAEESIARLKEYDVDAILMGDMLERTTDAITRLTNGTDRPVAFLTDAATGDPIPTAVEAVVTDVCPLVTAESQYALLVERITSRNATNGASPA